MKTTPQAVAEQIEDDQPMSTPEPTTSTIPISTIPTTTITIPNGPAIGSEDLAVAPATRTETDSLGSREVPADAYWGIHTARALENFPITRRAIFNYPDLIVALARVKQAGARRTVTSATSAPRRQTSSTGSVRRSWTASGMTSSSSASSRVARAHRPT